MKKSVDLYAKHHNMKHWYVIFKVRDIVLLSTRNLRMKRNPEKFRKRSLRFFKVEQKIGQQADRFSLLDTWKIHLVFHISLLKK